MSFIFYYSNKCAHSKELLQRLAKMDVASTNAIHYICIDTRKRAPDGEIYVTLDDGKDIILPKSITHVPALLSMSNGYKVVTGEEIIATLAPIQVHMTTTATGGNMVPSSFKAQQHNNYATVNQVSVGYSSWGNEEDVSSWEDMHKHSIIPNGVVADNSDPVSMVDFNKMQQERDNMRIVRK